MNHIVTKHGFTVSANSDTVQRTWDREDRTHHYVTAVVTEGPSQSTGYARITYKVRVERVRQPYNALEERWTLVNVASSQTVRETKLREVVMDAAKLAFRDFDFVEFKIG